MTINYRRIRGILADPAHQTTPALPERSAQLTTATEKGPPVNTKSQDALARLARWTRDANNLASELDRHLQATEQLSPVADMLLLAARQAGATDLADINRAVEQVDGLRNQLVVLLSVARDVTNQYAYAVALTNKRIVNQVTL